MIGVNEIWCVKEMEEIINNFFEKKISIQWGKEWSMK